MDPHGTGAPPSGSLTCMLCRGSIPFSRIETQNYRAHLQHHHGVFYHHDVLISVNLLSKNYLSRIVQECADNGERSEFFGDEDTEEVVELEETADRLQIFSSNLPNNPKKPDVKKEYKVHNCKTCNTKFERLGDLIEHVNEHKAEEKRKQEEIDMKMRELEAERRRVLEEKKLAKQQKRTEKRKLEEDKFRAQMLNSGRQTELLEDMKDFRRNSSQGEETTEEEKLREITKVRKALRQSDDADVHMADNSNDGMTEPHISDSTSHYNAHNRPSPVLFQCKECPFTCKKNIELQMHGFKHSGDKNHVCEICDEKFYLDRHLKRHMQKHEAVSELSNSNNLLNISGATTRIPGVEIEEEDDPNISKKKLKKFKTESNFHDETSSVLSWNSNNSEDSRHSRPKSSLGPPSGRGVGDVVENSEYFRKYPNQIKKGSPNDERFLLQEPSMPEGWKVRKITRPSGREEKEFLSPDFMVFRSRISMVEYLKYMGQSTQEEIERAERELLKKKC